MKKGAIFGAAGSSGIRKKPSASSRAQKAVEEAKQDIFQTNWRKVYEPRRLKASVAKITESETP